MSGQLVLPDAVRAFHLWTSPSLPEMAYEHQHRALILVLRGHYDVQFQDGAQSIGPGYSLTLPQGLWHRPLHTRRSGSSFVVVEWSGGADPPLAIYHDINGRQRMLAEWLVEHTATAQREDDFEALCLAALLLRCLPQQGQLGEAAEGGDEDVRRLAGEMAAKLDSPITLAQLAALARCSPQHFSKRFRRMYNMSPMAWYQSQRLLTAQMLLAQGTESPRDIAQRCGYRHVRNMYRALRAQGFQA